MTLFSIELGDSKMNLKLWINSKKSISKNNLSSSITKLLFTYFAFTSFFSYTVSPLYAGSKGDINDDGSIDILDVTRSVNIILGISPSPSEYELWAADFNSDLSIDVLDVTNEVNVILGRINQPPFILNITPSSGGVGTQITIAGENFGEFVGESSVLFNDILATATDWSNNQIIVDYPSNASSGPVIVIVDQIESNIINFNRVDSK